MFFDNDAVKAKEVVKHLMEERLRAMTNAPYAT